MRSIIITVLLLWGVTGFSQITNYDREPAKPYQTIGTPDTSYYSVSAPTGIGNMGTVYLPNWTLQYYYYNDGDTIVRIGVRGNYSVTDITLTVTGFNGEENTDWENIESIKMVPILPTGVTLTLISGGVKIDWTVESDDITEIWGKSNSEEYALLYTLTAGTITKNDIISPVDLRYYKLRTKIGNLYSAFSNEQSIAMLGPNLISNGGTSETTDWVDTDANGYADGWAILSGTLTASIVTGGGFTGNAQRFDATAISAIGVYAPITLAPNNTYLITGYYACNATWRFYTQTSAQELGLFTTSGGVRNAFSFTKTITTGTNFTVFSFAAGYIIIDNLSIKRVL
jgi:hypothetical protein